MALTLVLLALLGGGVAGGSFFFYRFLTRSPHFALREIRVSPTTHLGAEDVRARSGLVVGDNLFRVDLDQAVRRVRADPWIADVKAWRELPGAVVLTVRERQPAVVVALGTLYLADARGEIFKRASPDEAAAWPIVTGVTRDGYIHDRESAQALLREACAALLAWQDGGSRAPIGEVHVDVAVGVTLYTREQGLGIRVGRVDPAPAPRAATSGGDSPSAPQAPGAAVSALAARLARVDRVLVALAVAHEHPALLLADHQAHPDRVTVQLEGPR